jgi:hypothetical protein
VPKPDVSARPPPRWVSSFWFGEAWQVPQLPAKNSELAVGEIGRTGVGNITRRVQSGPEERCGQDQIAGKTDNDQQSGEDY